MKQLNYNELLIGSGGRNLQNLMKKKQEELIDIWHFVVQASLELKLTPDAILDEYKRKNEINRDRQRNGY